MITTENEAAVMRALNTIEGQKGSGLTGPHLVSKTRIPSHTIDPILQRLKRKGLVIQTDDKQAYSGGTRYRATQKGLMEIESYLADRGRELMSERIAQQHR